MKNLSYFILTVLLFVSSCKEKIDPVNADLNGRWERVDGNNSPLNGMVVDFSGTEGELITVPQSAIGFNTGDNKWRKVLKETDGVFTIEDLSSNGTYVQSRIFVLADGSEMMLSAVNSQAGNYQKWKRL